ncbi:acyl-CoA thioesterase/bile acid-CoA:amino acid N-acyltransferase family protein [Pseudonocardia hierapolitana]|uniref:acyl-CoA thioesterase/bile acid-CoA:amino acid N-acyltransferase family protein n=1 Tax=Pseudonocardia hierapolitana TaxID=1128676 RepID=UPI001FE88990|nr:acyl-CoA thioesterase/bile acid-CoA:amino acid N-acyltransferase family protein [Pseudonocardia hierapolitana]
MLGVLPWVLYWVLIGNVMFRLVVCLVLAVAVGTQVVSRLRRQPWRIFDLGSIVVFAILTLTAFVFTDAILERWLQPLGNLGLFLVALVGLLVGRPFVWEYATEFVDATTARSDRLHAVTTTMTWLWVAVFAAMTVVTMIPPLVDEAATIRDAAGLLSVLCYWVLPCVLLGLAASASGLVPPWFEIRSVPVEQRETEETPAAATQSSAPSDIASDTLVLDVPQDSRHDEPFAVVLHGAPAGSAVELTATGNDLHGRLWRSAAMFAAPASGPVDIALLDPLSGDWERADGDAPLWAMRFAADGVTPDLFVPPTDPWLVTVTARVERVGEVRRTVRRHPPAEGVRSSTVEIDGRPGLLALPPGTAPADGWPAVACFGGSEGGFESQVGPAMLLASRGFAALAASWVDEGAPIVAVPLERFGTTVRFLADHSEVDSDRVAGMAVSRGAEGLLSAVCAHEGPRCRGLVLISPSSVTWQAIGSEGEIPDAPSWTVAGRDVPWLPVRSGALMSQLVRNAWWASRDAAAHRPTLIRLRPAYEAGLRGPATGAADARIPAEQADGPLLLVTGTEDAVWPSGPMAQEVLGRRLRPSDEHLSCRGAGHLVRLGVLPTDAQWTGGIALGGTRTAQAVAQRSATTRITRFLSAVTANSGDDRRRAVGTRRR